MPLSAENQAQRDNLNATGSIIQQGLDIVGAGGDVKGNLASYIQSTKEAAFGGDKDAAAALESLDKLQSASGSFDVPALQATQAEVLSGKYAKPPPPGPPGPAAPEGGLSKAGHLVQGALNIVGAGGDVAGNLEKYVQSAKEAAYGGDADTAAALSDLSTIQQASGSFDVGTLQRYQQDINAGKYNRPIPPSAYEPAPAPALDAPPPGARPAPTGGPEGADFFALARPQGSAAQTPAPLPARAAELEPAGISAETVASSDDRLLERSGLGALVALKRHLDSLHDVTINVRPDARMGQKIAEALRAYEDLSGASWRN